MEGLDAQAAIARFEIDVAHRAESETAAGFEAIASPRTPPIPRSSTRSRRCRCDDIILDGEATGVWGTQGEVALPRLRRAWLDGRDVTRAAARSSARALLDDAAAGAAARPVSTRSTDAEPWERACAEGWEGVIAKRRDSPYEHRRSPHWLKMKCEATQELVVGGFTDPQGARVGLGALLVGYFEGDDFVFAGKVGTGFDTQAAARSARAARRARDRRTRRSRRAIGLPRLRAHWVRPEIVVQVAFIEWTGARQAAPSAAARRARSTRRRARSCGRRA